MKKGPGWPTRGYWVSNFGFQMMGVYVQCREIDSVFLSYPQKIANVDK